MNAIVLPAELKAWAEAEVEAGRASSIADLAVAALVDYRRRSEAFLKSLDDAVSESERDGWLSEADVFEPLLSRFPD